MSLRNIFDMFIAARVLGRNTIGLDKLLDIYFGITLSKTEQWTDWSNRPLTDSMKDYAANDVQYLIDLRNHMRRDLKTAHRYQEVKELFEWMERFKGYYVVFNPNSFLSLPKARELPSDALPTLKALYL